ncbi:uncharacterized protein F4807DRAFT_436370 [Annulohypoxylon truncatum]|uniref:uncharacterized protein n=1 Tax=Annulohypoxylon truncatum TaxID=327061 RepID=UPI002007D5C1|nr:uncharacterized protein F4807DRAFT_436370 [Annulohypoxylon truncatum]KAI1207256.1 hypothetical protein F4807DRAFT_436370 [Annulohypoxylon truncatum]
MSGATEESAPDAGQGGISTPSSLSGQKRTRGYGEQLKGLSQSDDEDMQEAEPSPALKKQKTDHFDDGDSDLDDGEIVESSPAQHATRDVSTSALEELGSVSNTPAEIRGPGDNTYQPSEDGEIDSNMADDDSNNPFFIDTTGTMGTPVQHSGWNQGVSVGARTSFGKPTTQLFPGNASTAHTALSSVSSLHIHEAKDKDDEDEGEDEDDEDPKDRDYQPPQSPKIDWFKDVVKPEPKPNLTFSVGGVTWNLRRQAFRAKKRNISDAKTFWNVRLYPWILALAEANEDMADRITAEVVKAGFNDHVNRKRMDSLLTGHINHINKIRPVAQEVLEKADLKALISKAQNALQKKQTQTSEGKTTGKKSSPANESALKAANPNPLKEEYIQDDAPSVQNETTPSPSNRRARKKPLSPDEELRLQRRYFPLAEDPSIFCLCCSGIGHKTIQCPLLQCKFCGSEEHRIFACPTRRRCSKCRQLGHRAETCNEKLALAPGEQDECAFCGAEHSDEQCTEIWRTYKVVPGQQKKVKDIPVFCYTCGGSGHYGPECDLPDKGIVMEPTSWSQANRNLYIDPDSENVALALVNAGPAPSFETDIRIRGTATKRVHTHFVSDDSDEDLIHAPVQRSEPRGQIRISSNIGSVGQGNNRGRDNRRNNDQSRRRQNEREFSPPPPPPSYNTQGNGGAWQPPLPPGPPPPRDRNERPLAPPPRSLPPRPATYDSGSSRGSSNNRGGQNNRGGRGGYRGGGRGGGRGGRGRGRGK